MFHRVHTKIEIILCFPSRFSSFHPCPPTETLEVIHALAGTSPVLAWPRPCSGAALGRRSTGRSPACNMAGRYVLAPGRLSLHSCHVQEFVLLEQHPAVRMAAAACDLNAWTWLVDVRTAMNRVASRLEFQDIVEIPMLSDMLPLARKNKEAEGIS